MGRLAEKVAVITGGASGIGAAAAEKLLGEGAYVVLGDIQEQAGPTWWQRWAIGVVLKFVTLPEKSKSKRWFNLRSMNSAESM